VTDWLTLCSKYYAAILRIGPLDVVGPSYAL